MDQNTQETTQKQPKLLKKTLQAVNLVNHGMSERDALQVVHNKDKISNAAISKFKAKVNKYSLSSPKIQKLADSQLKRVLEGRPRIVEIPLTDKAGVLVKDDAGNQVMTQVATIPTDTNTVAVLGMVYDRTQPAVKMQANINIEFSPVDLSAYYNGSRDVVDVTPAA
jgi:hypothetical protein